MKSHSCLFNGFLALVLLVCTAGCLSSEERKLRRQLSSLRIHVEADGRAPDWNSGVTIHRASPINLNIDREPVLDESNVAAATIVDQPGGLFSMEIKFDRRGSWIL